MTETSRKPPDRGLVITVSGFHGSGRTTHAKRLARAFGLRYVSSGTIFRQMAEERVNRGSLVYRLDGVE